ncbi:MAG: aspartate 1-decarboxylase [Candidatus Omnitrophica bacterium 4484_171]|nr:MAG: aspartate 1-decarboxylase [Candidatus Omnitrophica bacterium 4484_171]
MLRTMLKSKIYYAVVTEAELYYRGSITIDEAIMQEADIKEGEKVEVLNLNNGVRIETYAIKGGKGSGIICLNGPAARTGFKGDKIIILSYGIYNDGELKNYKAKFVEVDEKNEVKNTFLG